VDRWIGARSDAIGQGSAPLRPVARSGGATAEAQVTTRGR
jgi:hypothetical protein